jgi:hypothetical protein
METMVKQPTDDELKRTDILLERMIKRLNSRCKGLLEALGSEKASETSLKYFMEASGLQNDDPDVYSSSSAPPHSKATGIRNFLAVTYLHRTVRDYLEQPPVWSKVLLLTQHTNFDPDAALLMSYVIDVKTTDWFIDDSLYDAAKLIFKRIAHLKPAVSESHVALIEELDRVFTARLQLRFDEHAGHWSHVDPILGKWEPFLVTENSTEWQGDISSMAIVCNVNWYLKAKISSYSSVQPPSSKPGLPLLAYALRSHKWTSQKGKTPDISSMEKLLQHGANPNAWYKGCTLWQYTIHRLHVLFISKKGPPNHAGFRETWLEALNLLLRHGADAEAFWAEEDLDRSRMKHAWHAKDKKEYSLKNARGYDIFRIPPHIWTREPHYTTVLAKGEKHKMFQHSVSEVICDVFGEDIPKEYEQIYTLMRKRKDALPRQINKPKMNPNRRKKKKK